MKNFIIFITFILMFMFVLGNDTLLIQDFEGSFPPSQWTIIDADYNGNYLGADAWQYSTYDAFNGSRSARSSYSNSGETDHWFITKSIDLSSYASSLLKFYYKTSYNTDGTNYLKITTNADSSNMGAYSVLESFSGAMTEWDSCEMDLSAYIGNKVFLAWQTTRSSGIEYWYIDDILVTGVGTFAHNVSLSSILVPPSFVIGGKSYFPQVTVSNIGENTETFYTHCFIDSAGTEIYSDSVQVISLAASNSQNIIFKGTSSFSSGNEYLFTFYTDLSGDGYNGDDTLIRNVNVIEPLGVEPIHPIWPLFSRDRSNSGRSDHCGPEDPFASVSYTTGNSIHSSPIIGADTTIYFGTDGGYLYAMNPDLSTYKWRYDVPGGNVRSTPAIDDIGNIYFVANDDSLHALTSDGIRKWTYYLEVGANPKSPPIIGENGIIYITVLNNVYAIDNKGKLKWSLLIAGNNYSSGIVLNGNILYTSVVSDSRLYAIQDNGNSSQTMWQKALVSGMYSTPSTNGDTIYFTLNDGKLYAIQDTGSYFVDLWSVQIDPPKVELFDMYYSSPAIGFDNTIYVGTPFNNLVAVSPDGEIKWKYTVSDRVWSSPVIDSNGIIYFGSNNDTLYALEDSFYYAAVKWKFPVDGNMENSVALVNPLYCTSDNRIYRIETGSTHLVEQESIINNERVINNYILKQNIPNPFSKGSTIIKYQLPDKCNVSLTIFDVSGRMIRTLVNDYKNNGWHSVKWNGQDNNGKLVKSGIYFYKLESNNFSVSKRLLYIK